MLTITHRAYSSDHVISVDSYVDDLADSLLREAEKEKNGNPYAAKALKEAAAKLLYASSCCHICGEEYGH